MEKYSVTDENAFSKIPIKNGDINLDDVTSITGVYKFDIMVSNLLDCRLFLFGDYHIESKNGFINQDNGSLYLPLYLDALFKKHNDKQFDFMIELPPNSEKIDIENYSESVIRGIIKQFNICYQGINNKIECSKEWPNVRFHNVDIRHVELGPNEDIHKRKFLNLINCVSNSYYSGGRTIEYTTINTPQQEIQQMFNLQIYPGLIGYLRRITENNCRFIFKIIQKDRKFRKYKNVRNIDKINVYLMNLIRIAIATTSLFENADRLKNKKTISYYEFIEIIKESRVVNLNIAVILTGYYELIRLMKITEYGGKNIICLLGGNHINRIKNFIKGLDNDSYFIRGGTDISDILYNFMRSHMDTCIPKNLKIRIRLGLSECHALFKYIKNCMLNDKIYDQVKLAAIIGILEILDDEMSVTVKSVNYIGQYPSLRIIKINSSLIENSLI